MHQRTNPARFHRRAAIAVLAMIAAVSGSLQCRRATSSDVDPVDREAEEALVSYLRIDTSNPPGNETAGARFLQQLLAREGIEAQLVGGDPARQSVYARLRSGSREKALLLLHHIDVVPAVAGEWTKPPFAAVRSGGYIWGRGALDIKSLGIAEAMAMIELKRRNLPLKRDVIFLGVADEEAGGLRGVNDLLEHRPDLFTDVGFVLNEGGYNETIVDRVAFWGIEIQQKVPLWLRIDIKGVPGHSASPPDDGGTIMRALRVLENIRQIPAPYRLTPAVQRYYQALGKTKNDARGQLLASIAEPLDTERIDRTLSPGYRSLLHDTIAVTRFDSGNSVNAIPAHAVAEVDIRLLPDEKPDAMLKKVRDVAGKWGEVTVILTGDPVAESPSDTELFAALSRAMQKSEPHSAVAAVVGAGTSDSRFFRARGITAYGIAPFKVNYYDADTVHGIDERIRSNFFQEGVHLMRAIVADFCATRQP
ncbi:MAG TPA: M20/M25/M40 family metallo-hydrolase [Thermoanaerobaculia bacterium]|nr:M20/M25/M40 family metallo-hydrolase [Thermoanaerobaculia bacterium]